MFKANQAAQSEADRVRDLRLTSIASRYRVRPVAASEPQPEPSEWSERHGQSKARRRRLRGPDAWIRRLRPLAAGAVSSRFAKIGHREIAAGTAADARARLHLRCSAGFTPRGSFAQGPL